MLHRCSMSWIGCRFVFRCNSRSWSPSWHRSRLFEKKTSHSNGNDPIPSVIAEGAYCRTCQSKNVGWQGPGKEPFMSWLLPYGTSTPPIPKWDLCPPCWPSLRAWRARSASWLGAPMRMHHFRGGCWIKKRPHRFPCTSCSPPTYLLAALILLLLLIVLSFQCLPVLMFISCPESPLDKMGRHK